MVLNHLFHSCDCNSWFELQLRLYLWILVAAETVSLICFMSSKAIFLFSWINGPVSELNKQFFFCKYLCKIVGSKRTEASCSWCKLNLIIDFLFAWLHWGTDSPEMTIIDLKMFLQCSNCKMWKISLCLVDLSWIRCIFPKINKWTKLFFLWPHLGVAKSLQILSIF